MSVGAILVGVASILVVGAYLTRPFRVGRQNASLDRIIEAWVAQVRRSGGAEEAVNFCPQCGRRVGSDDRFCAGCGTPLQGYVE